MDVKNKQLQVAERDCSKWKRIEVRKGLERVNSRKRNVNGSRITEFDHNGKLKGLLRGRSGSIRGVP